MRDFSLQCQYIFNQNGDKKKKKKRYGGNSLLLFLRATETKIWIWNREVNLYLDLRSERINPT